MLSQARKSPDINNYLVYLFSTADPPAGLQASPQDYHLVRSAAALMLKNNVKIGYKQIPPDSLNLVKMAIPMALQDKNSQIRNYAGSIATELILRGGLLSWPELLEELLKLLDKKAHGQVSTEAQEGAIAALAKISEDNTKTLEREVNGQVPLDFILPKLIEATESPLPRVCAQALTAINVFTPRKSEAMDKYIDYLLQHLFTLADIGSRSPGNPSQSDDPRSRSPDVHRQVCRAFVQLVETYPDKLVENSPDTPQPHLREFLVNYILSQQKSYDEELACDAAEFWLAIGEHDYLWKSLNPFVPKVTPVLLECMVYSPEDIEVLGGGGDDADDDDREEDIRPQFWKKTSLRTGNTEASTDPNQNGKLADIDDDLEEGEIEDGDDANPDERWTLRKCSAAALDVFAQKFKDDVFDAIKGKLDENLKREGEEDWPQREAAVLALGAVAEGCLDAVKNYLPELMSEYLFKFLNDKEPLVRQITCWTLGRYSDWAAKLPDPTQVFEPMMEGILTKMLDENKKVQEAGASAFANLEDKAGEKLVPYSGPIIQQFVKCFQKYKDRNMYILYDCVQTLAERISAVLARPDLVNTLMPALIDRWNKVSDDSRELFLLFECLSYVATALSDAFSPYAAPIFRRCLNIIHQNLEQSMAQANNPVLKVPDKDFLITSLDLISSIIQALDKEKSAALVEESRQTFFELLILCMEDPTDQVRQSAYAVLGDCAKYVFAQLHPFLPNMLSVLLKQLDLDSILDEDIDSGFSVVNNACWSAGEIAIQLKSGMGQWVPDLSTRFVEIITNPGIPMGVQENAAIALGRLGLGNSELLAPHLANFAEDFLNSMDEVYPTDEKATAFRGFAAIVEKNPMAMEKSLLHFFTAIARYRDIKKLRSENHSGLYEDFQKVCCYVQGMHRSGELGTPTNSYVVDPQLIPATYPPIRPIYGPTPTSGPGGAKGNVRLLISKPRDLSIPSEWV